MNYRQSELLAATSIMTAGTKVLDIDVRDIISRLNIIVRATNASWTPTGHPALIVENLQLVDGSDVLFSMRGVFAQAVSFYGTRKQPFSYCNYTDNGIAVANCPIDFGRRLYDPELALNPKMFNNLQLKIQHDYSLGGADPDGCTLEVWADLFDELVPSPVGFLMSKSHWSKTLVASTIDYVDLPTDHPIRLVMPAAFSNDEEPDINIDAIKLSENFDKKVPINAGVLELLQMFESLWPMYEDYGEGRTSAGSNVEFFFTPCKDLQLHAFPSQDQDTYINFPWSGGNGRNIMGSATARIQVHGSGRCPHGVIPLPMGDLDKMEDWWDVTKLDSARAKLDTGGGDTSSYYELLLQQLRRY
jgi:hypothetical protein